MQIFIVNYVISRSVSPEKHQKETGLLLHGKGKGKAIPLQPLTGPEGSRRFKL
jgi:hypothetical protein